MKKLFVITILILGSFLVEAQNKQAKGSDDYQKHKGFYLSLAAGLNAPYISIKETGGNSATLNGFGGDFDIKIGGAIRENLLLHATLLSKSMNGPDITSNGHTVRSSNDYMVGEAMIGPGITYYTPENILVSGSIGLGSFVWTDSDSDKETTYRTDHGFSMQLKIGKEWWVSKKWGLGVALTYSKSMLKNTPGGSSSENWNSNNFGILFNASLN